MNETQTRLEQKELGIEFMISFRQQYFQAIREKKKLHEFRRKFSASEMPFKALIYISAPASEVAAIVTFGPTIIGDVDHMVRLRQVHNFSNDQNVRDYFEGCKRCYALPLIEIKELQQPLGLAEIRKIIPGFMPPQNYFRVNNEKYRPIIKEVQKCSMI